MMRKRIINQLSNELSPADQDWLNLERLAQVEITSEDEEQLIESALTTGAGPGWRASQPGEQAIRLLRVPTRRCPSTYQDVRLHCFLLVASFHF
jgi:hypothetical protein